MKIHPMGAKLFHADGRMDRRANMTKLMVAFCNFVNASKNNKTAMNLDGSDHRHDKKNPEHVYLYS